MADGMTRESRAAAMAALCDRMRMEPNDPLRAAFMMVADTSDESQSLIRETRGLLERAGAEVGDRAAASATRAMVANLAGLSGRVGKVMLALYVAVPLLAAWGGWMARDRAAAETNLGAMPPGLVRALQATDREEAWGKRVAQPPVEGRSWVLVPMWEGSGAPTPR